MNENRLQEINIRLTVIQQTMHDLTSHFAQPYIVFGKKKYLWTDALAEARYLALAVELGQLTKEKKQLESG